MDAKTTLYLIAAGVLALVFRRLVRKLVWRLVKLAGRFLAGHHLAGRRTDYGWWKPGDKDAPLARTVTRWGHASMATRAGVRLAVLAAGAGVAYGWHSHPGATLAAGLALAGGLALLECWHLVNLAKAWRHRRHVLHPMAAAIGPLLGVIPQTAHTLIHLPRTYGKVTDGEIGHVRLPDAFRASPDERKAVEHLVSSRLPVEIETRWLTAMTPMRLQINAAPKPPEMVRFSELRAEMDACQPGDIVIGLDRRRQVYRGSFRTADPHWGFSCASGRGKSAFLQMVCSQVLHQDSAATVTGVDPKMESLDPLIGVPGVRVANNPRDVPAMWQAIADFRAEMDRRMDQRAADPTAEFPLALLVVDEVNQFSAMTGAVWRELKERGQPAIAPVWMEVASILWQGRAFNCHLIMVGQRLDNHATGGIGLRDSLGLRGLAGFTPQQWMMLVGTTPVPRSQRPRGRWI